MSAVSFSNGFIVMLVIWSSILCCSVEAKKKTFFQMQGLPDCEGDFEVTSLSVKCSEPDGSTGNVNNNLDEEDYGYSPSGYDYDASYYYQNMPCGYGMNGNFSGTITSSLVPTNARIKIEACYFDSDFCSTWFDLRNVNLCNHFKGKNEQQECPYYGDYTFSVENIPIPGRRGSTPYNFELVATVTEQDSGYSTECSLVVHTNGPYHDLIAGLLASTAMVALCVWYCLKRVIRDEKEMLDGKEQPLIYHDAEKNDGDAAVMKSVPMNHTTSAMEMINRAASPALSSVSSFFQQQPTGPKAAVPSLLARSMGIPQSKSELAHMQAAEEAAALAAAEEMRQQQLRQEQHRLEQEKKRLQKEKEEQQQQDQKLKDTAEKEEQQRLQQERGEQQQQEQQLKDATDMSAAKQEASSSSTTRPEREQQQNTSDTTEPPPPLQLPQATKNKVDKKTDSDDKKTDDGIDKKNPTSASAAVEAAAVAKDDSGNDDEKRKKKETPSSPPSKTTTKKKKKKKKGGEVLSFKVRVG